MKRCPFCAENIQDDAVMCPFCSEIIVKRTVDASITGGKNGFLFVKNEIIPYTGYVITEYHKNGLIKQKMFFKEGIQHGDTITYYESGNILDKSSYNNGKLNGEFILYYENGQIKLKGNFINDKIDDQFISYFENGQIDDKFNSVEFVEQFNIASKEKHMTPNGNKSTKGSGTCLVFLLTIISPIGYMVFRLIL